MDVLLSRVQPEAQDAKSRFRTVLPGIIAVACYCTLAVLAYRPISPFDSGAITGATDVDPVQAIWYLEWVPFALFHGHNPFFTNFMDYPSGVNLATNTLASPLGLAASPMTLLLGPVATYNLLLRLALAASATSMCLVLRTWTKWWPAAFAGGLLYGFGSFMAEQGQWHLSLAFAPLPPLILWCLNELLVARRRSPRRVGILLGLLCAVQFLIHAESLADCALIGVIGVLVLAIAHRGEAVDWARTRLPGLGWATVCFGVICAYPIWLLVAGPRHITGPISPIWYISQDHSDLLSPVRRNVVMHMVTANGGAYMSHGVQLDFVNNTDYLGLPLAVLIVIIVFFQRKVGIIRFSALLALVSFALSLGPHLTLNGENSSIPLPAAVLTHVLLLNDMVWYRWSQFVILFACIVLSVGLDRWFHFLRRAASSEPARQNPSSPSALLNVERLPRFTAPVALCAITVAALIPLTSAYPLISQQIPWPGSLVSSLRQSVPTGGVVLALPYVTSGTDEPMAWQAIDHMHFRIVGGYATVPSPAGGGSFHVGTTKTLTLLDLATIAATAGTLTRKTSGASAMAIQACEDVPEVLRNFSVDAVVVWPTGIYQSLVNDFLKPALGMPSRHFGQALVWYDVRHDLARHPKCGGVALPRGTPAQGYWQSFSADCWTAQAGPSAVVRRRTVPGRGAADVFTVVKGRPYYTFAGIQPASPLDWAHERFIHLSYKGTGSGKTYQVYFDLGSNKVALYSIADKSSRWRTVSLPTAKRDIPAAAWSRVVRMGLALAPKSATGTIAFGCPVPSRSGISRQKPGLRGS